jgi:large subunit ribosomal protein L23
MKDPRDVILKPVITEKSVGLMQDETYTFVVHPSTNKIEVRQAIEAIYGVKVKQVNTLNRKGKSKRNRGRNTYGQRPDQKRAYVTLAPGFSIDSLKSDLLGNVGDI